MPDATTMPSLPFALCVRLTGASKLAACAVFALSGLAFTVSPPSGAEALSDSPSFQDELRSGDFGPEIVVIPTGRLRLRRGGCPRDRWGIGGGSVGAPF